MSTRGEPVKIPHACGVPGSLHVHWLFRTCNADVQQIPCDHTGNLLSLGFKRTSKSCANLRSMQGGCFCTVAHLCNCNQIVSPPESPHSQRGTSLLFSDNAEDNAAILMILHPFGSCPILDHAGGDPPSLASHCIGHTGAATCLLECPSRRQVPYSAFSW